MKVLRPLLLLSILLAACVPAAAPDDEGISSSAASVMKEEDDGENIEEDDEGEAAAPRIIEITADNWSFSPNAISVRKGEKVTVRLTGANGIHGFAIADLGINQRVEAGKTVDVMVPTDTTGTFKFFCSIPCGSGHKDMTGTITISE